LLGVGKEGAGARDVFFGAEGVDLVFDLVALVGDGEQADAVHERIGCAKSRDGQAEMVPAEIQGIDHEKQRCGRGEEAREEADGGRLA